MSLRAFKPLAAAAVLGLVAGATTLHGAVRIAPCASSEYTASVGQASVDAGGPHRLSIVLVGDTGFNPKAAPVDPRGFEKNYTHLTFAESLSGIAHEVDGDVAFVNLETVVTDRNDLEPDSKGQISPYNFRSHPAGLTALTETGFNLISLANNHSMDYGAQGAEETLYHLAVAGAKRALAYAGLGANFDEATRPGCLDIGGIKFGFGATGIVTGQREEHRAGPKQPGQAAYRKREDFEVIVSRLAGLPADYRLLSIHYGLEGRVVPDKRQLDDWRQYAAREKGIDLIVGHHPHVAQGVERVGDSLIFYGLGNFVHPGTAEMKRFGICRDYGLMAKVHLAKQDGDWTVGAIEAIALTNTHLRPERFGPKSGAQRIFALNYLSAQLDDGAGAQSVRFTPRPDGTGLYCAEGATAFGGKIGALCAGWRPTPAAPAKLARHLKSACADRPFYRAGNRRSVRHRPTGTFGYGSH